MNSNQHMAIEPKVNMDSSNFNRHFAAIVTNSKPNDWSQIAGFSSDDEYRGTYDFKTFNGNDIFAAYKLIHVDGRIAQIEYDSMDYVFLDCGELHWSGPLEADEVGNAAEQSGEA